MIKERFMARRAGGRAGAGGGRGARPGRLECLAMPQRAKRRLRAA